MNTTPVGSLGTDSEIPWSQSIVPLLRVIYHLWCYHQIWFTLRNRSQKMESKMVGFEPGSTSSVIWTIPLKRKKFCFAKTDEIFCLGCISIWPRKVSQIIGLLQGGQVGLEKQTFFKKCKKSIWLRTRLVLYWVNLKSSFAALQLSFSYFEIFSFSFDTKL